MSIPTTNIIMTTISDDWQTEIFDNTSSTEWNHTERLNINDGNGRASSESIGDDDERIRMDTTAKNTNIFELCRYKKDVMYEHNLIASLVFVLFIFLGVVYLFFGYRCFKAIMFLTGCIFGTITVYFICSHDTILPQYAIVGISLCAGVLFGLITMLIQYVGLFISGFHTGLLLCLVSITTADALNLYRINSLWISSAAMMGFAVLVSFLAIMWKRSMTIFGSSLFGSAMIASSMDYFFEKLAMIKWIWGKTLLKQTVDPCWLSWLLLAVWPVLMLVGLMVQCAVTGREIYHEKSVTSKKVLCDQNLRPRNRDQRAEMKQKKYRYLYQVRTAHGDVISQNYVQALQRKVIPGMLKNVGESSTLQSDATHLTTLPVDQTTQLASSECNTVDRGIDAQFDAGYYNLSNRNSMQSY